MQTSRSSQSRYSIGAEKSVDFNCLIGFLQEKVLTRLNIIELFHSGRPYSIYKVARRGWHTEAKNDESSGVKLF
jgi:hypothetical protein